MPAASCASLTDCLYVQDVTMLTGEISPGDQIGVGSGDGEVRMEGYLFKRTSNTFKTWVR
jgi:hypothetical protein